MMFHTKNRRLISLQREANTMSLSNAAEQGSMTSSNAPIFQEASPAPLFTQGGNQEVSFASTSDPSMFNGLSINSTTKKQLPNDRLKRSRERNRMHARKTRQRKKEHIHHLQIHAEELKNEHLKLRQLINEKNTASILVCLFSTEGKKEISNADDPEIEELLRRPFEDIPDASKVPELPALILPGQHKVKKRVKASASSPELVGSCSTYPQHELPDDGIDYELLGKDRSKCSPAELDQIRRERNRMHAKRTRDRKRLFMEEMEGIIKKLQQENELLKRHYLSLGGEPIHTASSQGTPLLASPTIHASRSASSVTTSPAYTSSVDEKDNGLPSDGMQVTADEIKYLLLAAGSFEAMQFSTASAVSASSNASEHSSVADQDDERSLSPVPKRQRVKGHSGPSNAIPSGLPMSISTSPGVLV